MKKHIPNMLTSCNLLSGAVAVYLSTIGLYSWALLAIIVGALFDFCDGASARLLGVSSPIGKELDSLADDITFGLAPSMMLFCLLKPLVGWWASVALLMAAFSALRLAKFNLDERQTNSFIGLATPANALFWASGVSMLAEVIDIVPQELHICLAVALLVLSLCSCYLLVSEIPFFSLKFHDLSWKNNKVRFVFLIGSSVVVLSLAVASVWVKNLYLSAGAVVIMWYVVLALFQKRN